MKLQKLSKIVDISNEIFLKGKINLNLLLLIWIYYFPDDPVIYRYILIY